MKTGFNLIICGLILVLGLWNFNSPEKTLEIYGIFLAGVLAGFVFFKRNLLSWFFLLGFLGTLAATPFFILKLFLTLAGAAIYYFYEQNPDGRLKQVFILSAAFLLNFSFWGVNFFFTPPWWALILAAAVIFGIFLRQIFSNSVWVMIYALILVEIASASLYLPFHFINLALLNFAGFYLLYLLGSLYLTHALSERKIYFHAVLIGVILVLSLISSPWTPLV